MKNTIKLKTDINDIKNLRESCKRIARVIDTLGKELKPGLTTGEINQRAFELITESEEGKRDRDVPAFLNYKPFGASYPYPGTVCISVNDEVVHGIGGDYVLKEGDIISLDGGIKHKGMISDHCRTFAVGKISKEDQDLLDVTRDSLKEGIKAAKLGNYVSDISKAIEGFIKKEEVRLGRKFGIVKILSGHGVGYKVHEEPYVPNYDDGERGSRLVVGMALAIEPMVNAGTDEVILERDGYTFRTADGSRSAHFEHTILITEKGTEVLTVI